MSERPPEIIIYFGDRQAQGPSGLVEDAALDLEPTQIPDSDRDLDLEDFDFGLDPADPADPVEQSRVEMPANEVPTNASGPPSLKSVRVTQHNIVTPPNPPNELGSQAAFFSFEVTVLIGGWRDEKGRLVGGFRWPAIIEVLVFGPVIASDGTIISPATFEGDLRELAMWVASSMYVYISQGLVLPEAEVIQEYNELVRDYRRLGTTHTRVRSYQLQTPVIYLSPAQPPDYSQDP